MDLNFEYSNNNSPNFAGIFARAYERISERRKEGKDKAGTGTADAATKEPTKEPEPQSEPAPAWNPYSRAKAANNSHAAQVKSAAEAVQTYTGRVSRATEGRPAPRVKPASSPPRQFDPARRRALPYQQEDPVGRREAPATGKHAKGPDALGRHASGPPPRFETRPLRPGVQGRHAAPGAPRGPR